MKKFLNPLSFGGLLVIFISCMVLLGTLSKKRMTENGFIVNVNILHSPSVCENTPKKKMFLELEYKGYVFKKNINDKKCSVLTGKQSIRMLTNQKEDQFIFFDDYDPFDFFNSFLIFGFGIFIIFKGASEKEKKKK